MKFRLCRISAIILKATFLLCTITAVAVAVYITKTDEFGAILFRRVAYMLEHIFAVLMLSTGASLFIDRQIDK